MKKKIEDKKNMAKDLYGIINFKTEKDINKEKTKFRLEEINMQKKKDYEKLIKNCEKEIKSLKKQKKKLEEEIMKEETIKENADKRIQDFYGNKNIFVKKDNINNEITSEKPENINSNIDIENNKAEVINEQPIINTPQKEEIKKQNCQIRN